MLRICFDNLFVHVCDEDGCISGRIVRIQESSIYANCQYDYVCYLVSKLESKYGFIDSGRFKIVRCFANEVPKID